MTCKGPFIHIIPASAVSMRVASRIEEKARHTHIGIESRRPLSGDAEPERCGHISAGHILTRVAPFSNFLSKNIFGLSIRFCLFFLSFSSSLWTSPHYTTAIIISFFLSRPFLRLLGALKKARQRKRRKKGKKANSPIIVSIRRASARPCTLERGRKWPRCYKKTSSCFVRIRRNFFYMVVLMRARWNGDCRREREPTGSSGRIRHAS